MTIKNKFNLVGFLLIIISVFFLIMSLNLKGQDFINIEDGSFFPAVLSFIMLICGIIILVEKKLKALAEGKNKDHEESDGSDYENLKNVWRFFIPFIIFIFLIGHVPFFPLLTLFLIISIYVLKGIRLKINIIVSVLTIIIIYFLFSKLFLVVFP